MKLTKTVKYNYQLTEETLEKDIDAFIKAVQRGDYQMDRRHGGDALKIIKHYFKLLQDKFDNNQYEECKKCYEKLILFCIDASGANDCDLLFDYEDLLAKITREFDDYVKNYFICLVKTCNTNELTERVARYATHLDMYGFDSDKKILAESLDKEKLDAFEHEMLAQTENMTKKDHAKQDILYFLIEFAETQKNKTKYLALCDRLKDVIDDEELDYLKEQYGGSEAEC